ncbi:MAG: phosphate signaling complex protein PhoU [Lachnospirales bacterium]
MRKNFDLKLENLKNMVIEMGTLLIDSIDFTIDMVIKKDLTLLAKIKEYEELGDTKEREIERYCLSLIASQHPVAKDLRFISSSLKMITDMERISDQALDIAEISLYLENYKEEKILNKIEKMAVATKYMISKSIEAFIKEDISLATEVIKYDDVVDSLFHGVKKDILDKIAEGNNGQEEILDLLMISKYFERIGDHATNISEWIIFNISGDHQFQSQVQD